jgi:hypothetical protein
MTALKKYWLVDQTGTKALVEGDVARDQLLPQGWSVASEPVGEEFVWMRHPEVAGPARFGAGALQVWRVKGWEPAGPPELIIHAAEQSPTAETTETAAGGVKETRSRA